jgi:hypothetical protein
MANLMGSLLAVLEGRGEEAMALMEKAQAVAEPEGLFYYARHCGMLNAGGSAVRMLRQARLAGFCSPYALEHDAVFAGMRELPEFACELRESQLMARQAGEEFHRALGDVFGVRG